MKVTHIFSDMDATLLASDGTIPQANINTIKNLTIPFSLVSARAPMEMDFAIDQLELDSLQVGFNGGIIYRGNSHNREILYTQSIDTNAATKIIFDIHNQFPDVSLSFYDEKAWYAEKNDRGIAFETSVTNLEPTIINFKEFLDDSIQVFKIMLIVFDEAEMQALVSYFDEYAPYSVVVQRSGKCHLEITHIDAIKSNGMNYILSKEDLTAEHTIAFGDGHNDIPMFKLVGHPVVMNNALDEVKDYGEFIAESNDDAGVAAFINRLNN